jgi:hypothetical protein
MFLLGLMQAMEFIRGFLPSMDPGQVASIEHMLAVQGVSNFTDIEYLTIDDLMSVMKPIQARRIICEIKKKFSEGSCVFLLNVMI